MKIDVNFDVYNISKRIKDIDKSYYIVFDTSKQKFEIHNSNQIGSTYCLTLPFNELDERCLGYVRKTQSVNIDELLNELECENNSRESAIKNGAFSQVEQVFEDMEKL